MKKLEFDINENNKLYFFPEYNRFALNKYDIDIEPNYCDNSLVKLRLEISYSCNGRCKYCLVFGNSVEKIEVLDVKEFWKELSSKEWFKNIKSIFIIGSDNDSNSILKNVLLFFLVISLLPYFFLNSKTSLSFSPKVKYLHLSILKKLNIMTILHILYIFKKVCYN